MSRPFWAVSLVLTATSGTARPSAMRASDDHDGDRALEREF